MLIESGFHMEAAVLVNAILEVSVLTALRKCVAENSRLEDQVKRLGHRRRLGLLKELLDIESWSKQTTELEGYWKVADELYGYRNSYVHELEFPDEGRMLTHRQQRELETLLKHFSDPWQQQFWFRWLESISRGEDNALLAVSTFCDTAKAEKVRLPLPRSERRAHGVEPVFLPGTHLERLIVAKRSPRHGMRCCGSAWTKSFASADAPAGLTV
jgi:hypothetical protein